MIHALPISVQISMLQSTLQTLRTEMAEKESAYQQMEKEAAEAQARVQTLEQVLFRC